MRLFPSPKKAEPFAEQGINTTIFGPNRAGFSFTDTPQLRSIAKLCVLNPNIIKHIKRSPARNDIVEIL